MASRPRFSPLLLGYLLVRPPWPLGFRAEAWAALIPEHGSLPGGAFQS